MEKQSSIKIGELTNPAGKWDVLAVPLGMGFLEAKAKRQSDGLVTDLTEVSCADTLEQLTCNTLDTYRYRGWFVAKREGSAA